MAAAPAAVDAPGVVAHAAAVDAAVADAAVLWGSPCYGEQKEQVSISAAAAAAAAAVVVIAVVLDWHGDT